MTKIKCIAIDDEPLALGLIVDYIGKTPFLELCGEFDNPLDAMACIEKNEVQLLFLDIHMPDLNGLDFTRLLNKDCKVIFTTAYDRYAIEGFKLEALDYLLKPISYEVFLKSALRAQKHFDLISAAQSPVEIGINTEKNFLFVKANYQIKRINFKDILYIEGLKDYVKIYTSNSEQPIVFHSTIKALEAKLPSNKFMRVHRSYIVNLDEIETVERYRIVFGKERIPVSEQYKPAFNAFIKTNFG